MRPDSKRIKELIRNVVEIIEKYIPDKPYRLYIFGSRAKGNNFAHSDLDLALEVDGLSRGRFQQIKREVNEIPTLYSIDLIDLNDVEEGFRNLIEKDMELVSERSK